MKIGYKFCGQCDAQLSITEVLAELKENLSHEFIHYLQGDYELMLVLQACSSPCLQDKYDKPTIQTYGFYLDGYEHSNQSELVKALLDKIKQYE